MSTVNTRIILRNDALSSWLSVNPVLSTGEVALARRDDGSYDIRIGHVTSADGGQLYAKTFEQLSDSLKISSYQVIGLDEKIQSLSTTHYVATSLNELSDYSTYVNGDTAIVSSVIADDKASYTAYIWDSKLEGENKWSAMDGNYNADNVYFSDDMKMTYQFGKYKVPAAGSYVLSSSGKSVAQVIADAYAETQSGQKTLPTFTFSYGSSSAKEVGDKYTIPPATLKMTSTGKYQYGTTVNPSTESNNTGISVALSCAYVKSPETGILSNVNDAMTLNSVLSIAGGSTQHYYTDQVSSYTYEAEVQWSQGDVPLNNIGGSDPDNVILSGLSSFTGKTVTFTGFRRTFYGTFTTQAGDDAGQTPLNSANIRNLTGHTDSAAAADTKLTVNIPVGVKSVVFAYPAALRDVSSVVDSATKYEIKSAFNSPALSVYVEGLSSYQAIKYKVYYTNFANPTEAANSYVVTI